MEGLRLLKPASFFIEEAEEFTDAFLLTARREFVRSILLLYFPYQSRSLPRCCFWENVDWLLKKINSSGGVSSEAADALAEANTPPSFILEESVLRILTSCESSLDKRTGFGTKVYVNKSKMDC